MSESEEKLNSTIILLSFLFLFFLNLLQISGRFCLITLTISRPFKEMKLYTTVLLYYTNYKRKLRIRTILCNECNLFYRFYFYSLSCYTRSHLHTRMCALNINKFVRVNSNISFTYYTTKHKMGIVRFY